jgi:hypothetical protein
MVVWQKEDIHKGAGSTMQFISWRKSKSSNAFSEQIRVNSSMQAVVELLFYNRAASTLENRLKVVK